MQDQKVMDLIRDYAEMHCPFSTPCDEQLEFELTKMADGKFRPPDWFGKWYVHGWIPSLGCAYGLFVGVWQNAVTIQAGGLLDADGIQEIFEYYPSQPLPVVKRYPRTRGPDIFPNQNPA